MKKLFSLSLLVLMAGFSACNNNDDPAELSFGSTNIAALGVTAGGEAFAYGDRAFTLDYTVYTNQDSWEAVSDKDWCRVVDVEGNTFTLVFDPNTTRTDFETATVTVTAGKATPRTIVAVQDPINHYKAGNTVYPVEYARVIPSQRSGITNNWLMSLQLVSGDIIIDSDRNDWNADPAGDGCQYFNFYCASSEEGIPDIGKYVYAATDWTENQVKTFDRDSFYQTYEPDAGYDFRGITSGSFNVVDRKGNWYHITIDDVKLEDNTAVTGFYKGNIYTTVMLTP